MTTQRAAKQAARTLSEQTGIPYALARRQAGGVPTPRSGASARNLLPDRASFDFDLVDACQGFPFATGVHGDPVIFDPASSPHALLVGGTGTGKSCAGRALVYGFLAHGADVYVIDGVKNGADFAFARKHVRALASSPSEATAVLRAVCEEVRRRNELNARHSVGSCGDLPAHVRPPRIAVFIEEFTSLLQVRPDPQAGAGPGTAAELATNVALVGVLARESRSAGVTLLLVTQRVTAVTVPSDLRVNLARLLLGKCSSADLLAALRTPVDPPTHAGHVPAGRGLWEPLTSGPVEVQVWDATQAQLEAALVARRPPLDEAERLDLRGLARREPGSPAAASTRGPVTSPTAAPDEVLAALRSAWDSDGADGPEVRVESVRLAGKSSTAAAWVARVTAAAPQERQYGAAVLGELEPQMAYKLGGVPILVDRRSGSPAGSVLVGAFDDVEIDPECGIRPDAIKRQRAENDWRERWGSIFQKDRNVPRPELGLRTELRVRAANGDELAVHVQPFVTLTGQAPSTLVNRANEDAMAACLSGAPFVSLSFWPGPDALPGGRHRQAFQLAWSEKPMPIPSRMVPVADRRGAQAVLAAGLDLAFDAVGLARPQVLSIDGLGEAPGRGYGWQVEVRMYGGVLLSDLVQHRERLAAVLGVADLRFTPTAVSQIVELQIGDLVVPSAASGVVLDPEGYLPATPEVFAALHDANQHLLERNEAGTAVGRAHAHCQAIRSLNVEVGQRVKFLGDRRWWTVEAADGARFVCTRTGNFGGSARYTIVEWGTGRRGPHHSYGHGATTREQCEEILTALATGEIELSERHSVYLDIAMVEGADGRVAWPS